MTLDLRAQQAALAEAIQNEAASLDPLGLVGGSERLSASAQVAIYREQFFLRHMDVLREDFGSLAHRLGAGFDDLARAYLAAHPPSSFTLRDLGHAMSQFVAEQPPWSGDAWLPDLARVEWAFVEAFDAPDAAPLDPHALAAVPEADWPDVRLVLHPALQLLALAHPAHEYRLCVREGRTPPVTPARVHAAIYRAPDALRCATLEAPAFALLTELARGTKLGEACEASSATMAPAAFDAALGAWFQEWTSLGWITHLAPASALPNVRG